MIWRALQPAPAAWAVAAPVLADVVVERLVAFVVVEVDVEDDADVDVVDEADVVVEDGCGRRAAAGERGHRRQAEQRTSHVSFEKFGSPRLCSQWLTVTLSCVNSPVQISTPIAIRTAPPRPMTTG